MIDENALQIATDPYGVTIYLTDVRDIIEAYEAARTLPEPSDEVVVATKRESVTQALAVLHSMIDGGEECRGRDSEISDVIRILEQGK